MTPRFRRPGDEFAREEGGGPEERSCGEKKFALGLPGPRFLFGLVRGEARRPLAAALIPAEQW